MRARFWGHDDGASSRAVTSGWELPSFLGNQQLRPVEGMLSASGHARPKLVVYPLASSVQKALPNVKGDDLSPHYAGVVPRWMKVAKKDYQQAGWVSKELKWSISNIFHLNQS